MQKLDDSLTTLYFTIDERNISTQKEYFSILNKLIDAICLMRYKNSNRAPQLSSAASLHSYLYNSFLKFDRGSVIRNIEILSDKLWWLSYCILEKEYLKTGLSVLYRQYLIDGEFNDTEFSNKLLNAYRNAFLNKEKSRIHSLLKITVPISPKRESAYANRQRLAFVQKVIQREDFDSIYLTADEFNTLVDNIYIKLCANKDLQKKGIIIDNNIKNAFKKFGTLSDKVILKNINLYDENAIKYIKNVFNRFKIRIGRLYPVQTNIIVSKLDFNLTNFQVVNQYIIDEMFSLLNMYLEREEFEDIRNNISYFRKVYKLLPFINLFREFEMNTFVYLILYYPKIEERLKKELSVDEITSEIFYDNLYLALKITKNYENMVDSAGIILGSEISKYINDDELTEYLKFYERMLKRQKTSIPNVDINYGELLLSSSLLYDKERIIIGRKFPGSCIDLLNVAGTQTYSEVLLGEDSNVIMVRDKNGEFISRILAFRKGNIIQLVARQKDDKYPIKLYKLIAGVMFKNAMEAGDNVDYIVISLGSVSINEREKEIIIDESAFYTAFPHADTSNSVIMLAGKKNKPFNLYETPKVLYEGIRRINYSPKYEDVLSMLSLYHYLNKNVKRIDEVLKEGFSLTYDYAIMGEDWIIIKSKDERKEYILPTASDVARNEVSEVLHQKTLVL